MNPCKAYRISTGDYVCDQCGVQWDKDDTAPPCKSNNPKKAGELVHRRSMTRIRMMLK